MFEDGTLVYEDEKRVIEWFQDFMNNASISFKTSVDCFTKYYEKCVNDLVGLPYSNVSKSDVALGKLNAIYVEDLNDFKEKSAYNQILEHMKNDAVFLQEALERNIISQESAQVIRSLPSDCLSKMTKEEVYLMFNDSKRYVDSVYNDKVDNLLRETKPSDEVVDNSLISLLKLHRLDNLKVKYAHTARIVYLTDLEVKKLGVENELVRSILYTSALFHDVGRFYQGAYYNSYFEGALKTTEHNGIKDHAEAGYYYSLLDMINLNVLGVATNEDLVIHSIASAVVKNHQLPNSALGCYDEMISDFKFNDNVGQEMLDFVLASYSNSEKFDGGLHGRFQKIAPGNAEMMRKAFTDSTVKSMSTFTGVEINEEVEKTIYDLFNYEAKLSLNKDDADISILREQLTGQDLTVLENKIANNEDVFLSPLYNEVIKNYKINKLARNSNIDSNTIKEFMENLITATHETDYYTQYDIVSTIDEVMKASTKGENYKGIKLNEDVAKVLRMSMGLVMDMDKLDILVQRAIKRYPDWKPGAIRVKSLNGSDENGLMRDESLVDVLENQFKFDIKYDDSGRIVLDEVLTDVVKWNVKVNDDFKKKFGDDYDFSKLEAGTCLDDVADEVLKSSFEGKNVEVTYQIMEKAFPDLAERYQLEMDLVLPPDLRENYFKIDDERNYKKGSNGAVSAFPLGQKASDEKHFCWANSFPGVWWQLDQFVMTNMRSMESLRFIKDTSLLDRVGEAYKSEDCPKEFGMFVDEAINFSKDFINLALMAKINDNGEMIFGEENQEGYSPVILSDKDTMIKIRNEAAIRYQDTKAQREEMQAVHDSQLDSMFEDEGMKKTVNQTILGNDLSSMMNDTSDMTNASLYSFTQK